MALLIRTLLASLLLIASTTMAYAQNVALAEQKIKVGMMYNFLKYTDWPEADAKIPMMVCLYGRDPFNGALQLMEGRSVNLRPIRVKTIEGVNEASACHLIVVGATDWSTLRASLSSKPILTVSDNASFVHDNGMIAFSRDNNRISVLLNIDAVREANLKVQPRLLNLVTVTRASQGGE